VVTALVVLVGIVLLPGVARWIWRLHVRVVSSLVPGADFHDVAALADQPVHQTLAIVPPVLEGRAVRLLGVTREAASLFLAYRRVRPNGAPGGDDPVKTLLLHVDHAALREVAILERWRAGGTPVVMATDLAAGEVAIQQPLTGLTVTLPLVA
jgi:hypothetical protein